MQVILGYSVRTSIYEAQEQVLPVLAGAKDRQTSESGTFIVGNTVLTGSANEWLLTLSYVMAITLAARKNGSLSEAVVGHVVIFEALTLIVRQVHCMEGDTFVI